MNAGSSNRSHVLCVIDRFLSSCLSVQFGNKAVAQAACDVFQLLISYWERLQRFDPSLPKKIIEVTHTRAQISLWENPESRGFPSGVQRSAMSIYLMVKERRVMFSFLVWFLRVINKEFDACLIFQAHLDRQPTTVKVSVSSKSIF